MDDQATILPEAAVVPKKLVEDAAKQASDLLGNAATLVVTSSAIALDLDYIKRDIKEIKDNFTTNRDPWVEVMLSGPSSPR